MKGYLITALCVLSFLFFTCSTSKTEQVEVFVEDVIVTNGNSLLWKIEKEGTETSYFFGTMHMINEEFYNFTEKLYSKIAESDLIIMEMDGIPNPITTYELMTLDTGSVHDYFTREQLIELLAFMDTELGMDPQTFDANYGAMKPFLLLQGITQNYFEPTAKSYDLTIMSIANEKNIRLKGLETIEEQLGFFDKIPAQGMAEMIIESIRDFEKERKNTLKLMELHASQKVDKLLPLMEKSSPEFMQYQDLFLYDRNKRWVPKIEEEMKEKRCFIAVGAGHLFGENGLIDLFEKEGYSVTPISYTE